VAQLPVSVPYVLVCVSDHCHIVSTDQCGVLGGTAGCNRFPVGPASQKHCLFIHITAYACPAGTALVCRLFTCLLLSERHAVTISSVCTGTTCYPRATAAPTQFVTASPGFPVLSCFSRTLPCWLPWVGFGLILGYDHDLLAFVCTVQALVRVADAPECW